MAIHPGWWNDQIDRLIAQLPLDDDDNSSVIDSVHKKIHDGKHFSTSYYEKIAGAASAVNILITAPSSGSAIYHFVAEFDTDGPGIMTLSKAPNATASGGSVITAYNNDENNTTTLSTLTHVACTDYTSSGTVLATYVIGGSSGVGASKTIIGGAGNNRFERILGSESVHLIRWVADLASCRTAIRTHFYKES